MGFLPDTSPRPQPVRLEVCGVIAELSSGHNSYRACAFTRGAGTFVTAGLDGEVFLWSLARRRVEREIKIGRGRIYAVDVSPDGRHILASTRTPRGVVVWDVARDKMVGEVTDLSGNVRSFAVARTGDRFAFVDQTLRVRVCDFRGQEVADFTDEGMRPYSVEFAPDGKSLAVGGLDNTVRLWDVEKEEQRKKLDGHSQYVSVLRFSDDGRQLLTGGRDRTARLWDVASGRELTLFREHAGPVTAAAFSPDGRHVVTGDTRGAIYVWNPATGARVRRTDEEHFGSVQAIAFTEDHRWMVSVDTHGTIRIWGGTGGAR